MNNRRQIDDKSNISYKRRRCKVEPVVNKNIICHDVIMPSPGESISEVTIGTWFKKDGDFVEKDEEILEVESEKTNLSIRAEISGILRIKLPEGNN